VRIIAGRFKGRRLKAPSWEGLRPTSDKLRETLFNILSPRIEGARVVDGFAGTGAVGIEALSRGAAHVLFIERDRRAAGLIASNLDRCGVKQGYTIECGDVGSVLRRSPGTTERDLVLLDPPYDIDPDTVTRALEAAAGVLTADGLVVFEHAARREPDAPAGLTRLRDVVSGDSTLTFYEADRKGPPRV
jgi:16S rRNA (guanine(966)-N(2))-methyltransferase RsmD